MDPTPARRSRPSRNTRIALAVLGVLTPASLIVGAAVADAASGNPKPPAGYRDTVAPSVPTGLTAASGLQGNRRPYVALNWKASTDNIGVVAYEIYRNGASITTVTRGTTWGDLDIEPGATYTYTVRARDAAGNRSAPSSPATVTAGGDGQAPTAPANLRDVSTAASPYALAWDASSDNVGVTRYQVYRNGILVASTSGNLTTIALPLFSGEFVYRVTAFDQAGNESAPSNELPLARDFDAPSAPTRVRGVAAATSTTISWEGSIDNVGVVHYRVYVGDETLHGVETGKDVRSVTLGRIAKTTTFRVTAVDAAGNESRPGTVTVTVDSVAPTAPKALKRSGLGTGGTVELAWARSTDNVGVTGYEVYVGPCSPVPTDTSDCKVKPQRIGTTTTTSFTDDERPEGTFRYHVIALDAAGNTSAAASLDVEVDRTTPTAPGALTATPNGDDTVTFSWKASTDNTAVRYYALYQNGTWVRAVGAGTTTITLGGIASGSRFTVRAFDRYINKSAFSNEVVVDLAPPSAPGSLTVTTTTRGELRLERLSWTPSTDDVGVARYFVLINGDRYAPVSATATTFTFPWPKGTTAATATVVALDATGNVSAPSNAVTIRRP